MPDNYKKSDDKVFAMILDSVEEGGGASMASSVLELPQGDWDENHEEGKLSVDVAQTEDTITVVAPMAGSLPDRVEVYIHNDLLTIRGVRETPLAEVGEIDYYYQECFWGNFSRTIVLPVDVKGDLALAEHKNGVLKIVIPKQKTDTRVPIRIVEE